MNLSYGICEPEPINEIEEIFLEGILHEGLQKDKEDYKGKSWKCDFKSGLQAFVLHQQPLQLSNWNYILTQEGFDDKIE